MKLFCLFHLTTEQALIFEQYTRKIVQDQKLTAILQYTEDTLLLRRKTEFLLYLRYSQ